jgi:GGDEF domain-containing protein
VAVPLALAILSFALALVVLHLRRRSRRSARGQSPSSRTDVPRSDFRGRARFTEDLDLEVSRGDRTGRAACLLVVAFADHWSSADTGEARAGRLAHILAMTLRKIDLRYRIGLNEFAVILPETRAEGALVAARRVAHALCQAGVGEILGGVAETGPGLAPNDVFRHAYCAMLAAGRNERPGVIAYSPPLESSPSPPATARD